MAYDFGSTTLGIKNPFKVEGTINTIAGLVVFLLGIYPLIQVADLIKEDAVSAYGYAIIGALLILSGANRMKQGIFSLFRFFVGRSVPTSLAYNYSKTERETAELEARSTLYTGEALHSMLMGRKNSTFIEPTSWVGRLIHSLAPKLTFLPYQLRNVAQELAAMALNIITAIVLYLVLWFVIASGLAGEKAQVVMMPIVGILLLIYLTVLWMRTANSVGTQGKVQLNSSGGLSFGALIVVAILGPILFGYLLETQVSASGEELAKLMENLSLFGAGTNLVILALAIIVAGAAVLPVFIPRIKEVSPSTEVSEWRDNFQESVHPNEIFINIDNIVLANRRYREIPNRVYQEWDPRLNEQTQGKGSFEGQLLIETQPEYSGDWGNKARKTLLSAVSGAVFIVSALLMLFFGFSVIDLINTAQTTGIDSLEALQTTMGVFNSSLLLLFAFLTVRAASKLLKEASHLFWGEMHFTSLLMFMKTEGTFTESKISTGMAYNDSTRSENEVVRSSITPWVITTRAHTSTFATTGVSNLEQPRFLLSMTKNDGELENIKREIIDFLKGREYIASITNESDLRNVSNISSVNVQTKQALADGSHDALENLSEEDIAKILHHKKESENNDNNDKD